VNNSKEVNLSHVKQLCGVRKKTVIQMNPHLQLVSQKIWQV